MTSWLWGVCRVPTPWDPPYPWSYRLAQPWEFVRLHGVADDEDVGTVLAAWCVANGVEAGPDLVSTLDALLAMARDGLGLILPGGLQVHHGDEVLGPGCCCGLEDWPEWQALTRGGPDIWWGHDPDGSVQVRAAQTVRVASADKHCDLTMTEFTAAVGSGRDDLIAFLDRLHGWLARIAPSQARSVTDLFAREMNIA